jgi:hypothetical protein
MKIMQYVLYIFALLFLVSGVFAVLPFPWINDYMQSAGGITYPDDAMAVYTMRSFLLIIFWLGVLIFVAVRDPVTHARVLQVLGGMFLSTAVLCLVLGMRYGLPKFYYYDVISSAVLGVLLLGYHRCARAAK